MEGTEKIISSPEWYAGKHCVVCGSPHVQMHHVIGGTANRRISDKYKYVIPLCVEHHTGGNGIHRNRGLDLYWTELAQEHYERHIGSRRDFIKEFGKSYL